MGSYIVGGTMAYDHYQNVVKPANEQHEKNKKTKNKASSTSGGNFSGGGGGGVRDNSGNSSKTNKKDKGKADGSGKNSTDHKNQSTNSGVTKDEPEVCTPEEIINDTIDELCKNLQDDYYKKYKDTGARKAISKTISELKNQGKKNQDIDYVKEKCDKYRKGMRVGSYTTDVGVTYLSDSLVSLDGHAISNAFIADCSGSGSFTFTLNITEYYTGSVGISTTMVQFSASIPYFSKDVLNSKLGASIQLVNISLYWEVNSFIRVEIGGYIGIGAEVGVYTDLSRLKIEIYCGAGLVLGVFSKTTIDINAVIVPVS